ncbi:hypothetical protein [Paraburkholderia sp. BL10I2N1]|uniref:hypothetical protein n=1 Tax=Paraburkholderia sp. BL10I2N1 TaxID=1938796 RepID=UPI00105C0B2D|nr:hypothetical protein [Paraburkholderia sp. BL10I2N1]
MATANSFMERPVPPKRQDGTTSDGQLRNRRSIGQIGLCERGVRRQCAGIGNNIGEPKRPALRCQCSREMPPQGAGGARQKHGLLGRFAIRADNVVIEFVNAIHWLQEEG